MIIGAFGNLIFSVSSQKVYTFDNLSLSASYNTESQELIGSKPSTYKKGPGLDQVSFDIILDQSLGINVETEMKKWMDICKSGAAYPMNIGGKNISENPLMLKAVEVGYKAIGASGELIKIVLGIKLEEFVRAGSAKSSGSTTDFDDYGDSYVYEPDKSKIVSNANVARAKAGGQVSV